MQLPYQKGKKRIHRLVVLPEFQGIGIGTKFLTTITEYYVKKNWTVFINTSNKGLVYSLKKNKHWKYNDTHLNTIVLRERPELSKYNISTEDKKIKSKNIGTNIDNVFTREISSFKTNKEIFYKKLN